MCSSDLRTVIVGTGSESHLERILLHHQDYQVSSINPLLTDHLFTAMDELLQGQANELLESAVWNGGFYLWHCGVASDLRTGMAQAQELIVSGRVRQQLQLIIAKVSG